jgi:ribokinase
MRTAVVGHVEVVEFCRVPHVPAPGEIVHTSETWAEAAGGGAVAAVQLCKLAGNCTFFTALGEEELGGESAEELAGHGLDMRVAWRDAPQRRGWVHVDDAGERTITVIGPRMGPHGADRVGWEELDEIDAVYFTAGDVDALREARRAKVLVATARALETLVGSGVQLDALVRSARDKGERYERGLLEPAPRLVVATEGSGGGSWHSHEEETGRWKAAPLPGPVANAYGAGDSFAAGLTYALGAGIEIDEALELASRCGAANLTGKGAYDGQLRLSDTAS